MSRMSTQLPSAHAQEAELTENEQYRILSDEHRRLVLDILNDHAAGLDLEELAESVADQTDGQRDPKRVQVSLHHKHLPILENYDVVEYDHETRWVQFQ